MPVSASTLLEAQNTGKRLALVLTDEGVASRFNESAARQKYPQPYRDYLKSMRTTFFGEWGSDGIARNLWHATRDPLIKSLAYIGLQISDLERNPLDPRAASLLIVMLHNLALNMDLVAFNGGKLFRTVTDQAKLSQVWSQQELIDPGSIETPQKLFTALQHRFAPHVRALTNALISESGISFDHAVAYLEEHNLGALIDPLHGRDTFKALQVELASLKAA